MDWCQSECFLNPIGDSSHYLDYYLDASDAVAFAKELLKDGVFPDRKYYDGSYTAVIIMNSVQPRKFYRA